MPEPIRLFCTGAMYLNTFQKWEEFQKIQIIGVYKERYVRPLLSRFQLEEGSLHSIRASPNVPDNTSDLRVSVAQVLFLLSLATPNHLVAASMLPRCVRSGIDCVMTEY